MQGRFILEIQGEKQESRFEIRDSRFESRDSRFEIKQQVSEQTSRFSALDSRFSSLQISPSVRVMEKVTDLVDVASSLVPTLIRRYDTSWISRKVEWTCDPPYE